MWRPSLERRVDNGAENEDIERIQKRALRIMYPELKYHEALMESNLKTLTDRRDDMCVQLIKDMSNPNHKLNHLDPTKENFPNKATRDENE